MGSVPGDGMKDYLVKDIKPDSFFTKTLYLDKVFVIATPETPFSKDLGKRSGKMEF